MDNEGQIHRGRGLVDLIAGTTPTYVDWTADPTDGADITDGDPTTICTTGNKVAGSAYQWSYFEWDLGGFYNVLTQLVGASNADAGVSFLHIEGWDGSAWIRTYSNLNGYNGLQIIVSTAFRCSKVRLMLGSNAAATISPNIREFCLWRI